jgi:formamidopyrimidine-DNA glycosylase
MPELPEVESFRRYLADTSLRQNITSLEILDKKIIKCPETVLEETVVNQQFIDTERIGKYLFIHLSNAQVMLMHFGMTGSLEYFHSSSPKPKFSRVIFNYQSGYSLSYIDPRKFGKIELGKSVADFKQQKKLSSDALLISQEEFKQSLQKRKAPLKSVLLDQSVAAGVGNWIADEMMFQALVHPLRKSNQLEINEIRALHQKMKEILTLAIQFEAYYRDFPKHFLIHSRGWTDEEPQPCPHCQSQIQKIYVGGRATYFCENCQI